MTAPVPGQRGPIARLRPGGTRADAARLRRRTRDTTPGDAAAATPWLREWHDMAPADRRAAWAELVDWVVWLHDRYELAREERLPECWAEHPGLIEELFALKAWRDNIYQADQPSGQAARYWHGELRQVIQAAATHYAAGCRAGHKPTTTVVGNTELRTAWLGADPLAGVPADLLTHHHDTGDGEVRSDTIIRDALHHGTAHTLSEQVAEFVHHDGSWWTPDQHGWRRVTDPVFAADLDRAAERMAIADHAAAQRRRFRDNLHQ